MLKEEFLSKLEKRLLGIPKEDLERTLDYYNEIISDKVEDGMSEEEAILQMELLGHEFFMFKDADTDNFAVVYKRKDENYGIIESE